MSAQEGQILNHRYHLLSLEGEGGMATVYRAQDLKLKRTVAVKILQAGPEANEAFQQEAQAAAGVPHPNIVTVYDIGQDGAVSYIVMEYVQGTTLQDLIQAEAPFRVGRALDIAIQICNAVEFIHTQGVIHCDLKPLNIMVLTNDQVKITDFGIARDLSQAPVRQNKTWGTPHYASPELISGKPLTPAADVYAVGVILYEMLTGVRPFDGQTAADIARQHILNAPLPIQHHNPRVPRYVQQVVDRALSKDPAKRYSTAGQMGKLLNAYKQHGEAVTQPLPISTRPETVSPQPTAQPIPQVDLSGQPIKQPTTAPAQPDWVMLILGLMALVSVVGLLPLWGTVIARAFTPPTPLPTPTPTYLATPTSTPTRKVSELPTPTPQPEEMAVVPDLVGQKLEEAQRLLQQNKLALAVLEQQYHLDVPEAHIISQNIEANKRVPLNSTVGVVVSLGPPRVVMPDTVGFPAAIKQLDLQDLGLKVSITETWSTEPKGLVIGQIPPAGQEILAGSAVTLTVSSGARGEVRANLAYKVSLVSCELNDTTFRPGDTLRVEITWEVLDRLPDSYSVFIHVTNQGGSILTQRDALPLDGSRPTNTWQPGEILHDVHTLSLPTHAPWGTYWLRVGLYKGDGRLPVIDPGLAQSEDNAIILGPIEVKGN